MLGCPSGFNYENLEMGSGDAFQMDWGSSNF